MAQGLLEEDRHSRSPAKCADGSPRPSIESQFFLQREKGSTEMATATKKTTKIRLQPMGERIVVKRVEREQTTAGGIVLPDSAREKPARGTVVAVGSGRLLDDGTRSPSQLKQGDMVLFSSYAGETVEVDEVEYLLMREDDVLVVIE
jgi:chaperonin GroES